MTEYSLEIHDTSNHALSAPISSTTPFGSYVPGTRFYLDATRAYPIAEVHHGVKVIGTRTIVLTRVVVGAPLMEQTILWPR